MHLVTNNSNKRTRACATGLVYPSFCGSVRVGAWERGTTAARVFERHARACAHLECEHPERVRSRNSSPVRSGSPVRPDLEGLSAESRAAILAFEKACEEVVADEPPRKRAADAERAAFTKFTAQAGRMRDTTLVDPASCEQTWTIGRTPCCNAECGASVFTVVGLAPKELCYACELARAGAAGDEALASGTILQPKPTGASDRHDNSPRIFCPTCENVVSSCLSDEMCGTCPNCAIDQCTNCLVYFVIDPATHPSPYCRGCLALWKAYLAASDEVTAFALL